VVRLGKRFKIPVGISLLVAIAAFSGLVFLLGRLVYASAIEFAERLPELEERFTPYIIDGLRLLRVPEEALPEAREKIAWSQVLSSDAIRGFADVGSLFGWIGSFVLVLFFLIFIVIDRGNQHLDRRLIAAFSPPGTERARPVVEEIHKQIERYIVIKTGIALLNGVLAALVLLLFGVPFAPLFGAITFAFDFIPNLGSLAATVLPTIVALVTFDSPLSALWVALALTVVQVGIANGLEPLILGKQLNLNSITVLLALVFFGWLWGIAGMVLAVPLAVSFRIVAQKWPALRPVETLMSDEGEG
jgi:predicted PurR-regulated permease PerM